MQVQVFDQQGRGLSPTSPARARRLLQEGKAILLNDQPWAIQLTYAVPGAPPRSPQNDPTKEEMAHPGCGRSLLAHICCAPCATFTIKRLREIDLEVTGYWYNPNIHPYSEHEKRKSTLAGYAARISLPMIWDPEYERADFLSRVHGREQFRVRCQICYAMRLDRTAAVATEHGFDAFTTTLLISPYQDLAAIRALGEKAGARHGVAFYFENLRRGWAERSRITREEMLYSQRYCGCVFSEREALDSRARSLSASP